MLCVCVTVRAQLYPVRGVASLTPPYSLYLPDYASPVSDGLKLNLLLADRNEPVYQVRLNMTIEGAGITLRLKQNINAEPIVLTGGAPVIISGADLEPYMNPQNLDFQGVSASAFVSSGGKLPEGVYNFCFQAFDYYQGVAVSAPFCVSAWIFLNDPPFLNQPFNQSKVTVQVPQVLRFQWTPMHRNSVNSAFNTEYILYLKEYTLDDVNMDPYELMRSPVRTLFTTTTEATSFVYDIDEPALTPGKRYAFAVQARDRSGRDMFKNEGMSEVFLFTYGDPLDPVDGLAGKPLSSSEAEFSWTSKPAQSRYTLRFRPAGTGQWTEKEIVVTNTKVSNLTANTDYEYQVRAFYGALEGPWSATQKVKTLLASYENNFVCGATPKAWDLGNTEPVPALQAGDTIFVSDFAIVLVDVTGGDGAFSGKGMVEVPFLNKHLKSNYTDPKVRLLVAFDNVNVNVAHRMIAGEMKVTSGGVQVTSDYYARTISDAVARVDVVLADLEEIATMIEDIEKSMSDFLGDDDVQIDESAYAEYSPLELVEEAKRVVKEAEEAIRKKDPDGVKNLKKGLALLKKAVQLMDEFKATGEYATELLSVLLEIIQENAELYVQKAESVKKLAEGLVESLAVDDSEDSVDLVMLDEPFSIEVPPAALSEQEKDMLDTERLLQDAFDFIVINRTIFLTLKYYTTGDNYSQFLEDFLHQIDGIYKDYRKKKQAGSEAEVRAFLKVKLVAILEAYVVAAGANQ